MKSMMIRRLLMGLVMLCTAVSALSAEREARAQVHFVLCMTTVHKLLAPPREEPPAMEYSDVMAEPGVLRYLSALQKIEDRRTAGAPLSAQELEDFSALLTDTLLPFAPAPGSITGPMDDLPERIAYLAVQYVARSQIGSLRPARERRDSYLAEGIAELAHSIDRDMHDAAWQSSLTPAQLASMQSALIRWQFLAGQLLYYKNKGATPLVAAMQLERMAKDLLALRAATWLSSADTASNEAGAGLPQAGATL